MIILANLWLNSRVESNFLRWSIWYFVVKFERPQPGFGLLQDAMFRLCVFSVKLFDLRCAFLQRLLM